MPHGAFDFAPGFLVNWNQRKTKFFVATSADGSVQAAQVEGACPRTPPGVACLQAKDALAEARRRLGTFLAEQDAALQKQQQETKAEAPAASEEGGCVSACPSCSFSCAAVGPHGRCWRWLQVVS